MITDESRGIVDKVVRIERLSACVVVECQLMLEQLKVFRIELLSLSKRTQPRPIRGMLFDLLINDPSVKISNLLVLVSLLIDNMFLSSRIAIGEPMKRLSM